MSATALLFPLSGGTDRLNLRAKSGDLDLKNDTDSLLFRLFSGWVELQGYLHLVNSRR